VPNWSLAPFGRTRTTCLAHTNRHRKRTQREYWVQLCCSVGLLAAVRCTVLTTLCGKTGSISMYSLHRYLELFPRIISGIGTLLWTTSSACWKRFCSQRSSAITALDVSWRCALQIYILLTYLLFVENVSNAGTDIPDTFIDTS